MREVLEAAERLAMEERKNRRKREEYTSEDTDTMTRSSNEPSKTSSNSKQEQNCSQERSQDANSTVDYSKDKLLGSKSSTNIRETDDHREDQDNENSKEGYSWSNHVDKAEEATLEPLQVPISKDVAIVLSGRLEDPDILSRANLQLVNLVVSPSRFAGNIADYLSLGLNAIGKNPSPRNPWRPPSKDASSCIVQNRLLTPSKYRTSAGRDCGTQTDVESDCQDLRDKLQDHQSVREQGTTKDRKETTNTNRRNIEK